MSTKEVIYYGGIDFLIFFSSVDCGNRTYAISVYISVSNDCIIFFVSFLNIYYLLQYEVWLKNSKTVWSTTYGSVIFLTALFWTSSSCQKILKKTEANFVSRFIKKHQHNIGLKLVTIFSKGKQWRHVSYEYNRWSQGKSRSSSKPKKA